MSDSIEFFIKKYALWYVTKYSTCSHHLKSAITRRLQRKNLFEKDVNTIIEKIVNEYQAYGYFDDELFIMQQTRKWQHKGYTYPLVVARLTRIGFDKESVLDVLRTHGVLAENTDDTAIINLLKNRGLYNSPQLDEATYLTKKRRALSILSRRGFSYSDAVKILEQLEFTPD